MNTQYINEQIQVLQQALKQYDAIFDSIDRDLDKLGQIVNQMNFTLGCAIEVIETLAPGKFAEMFNAKLEELKKMQDTPTETVTGPIETTSAEESHIILN